MDADRGAVGYVDGFAVDCMETCEHCISLIILDLVICKEEKGVFQEKTKVRRKNINIRN